MGFCGASNFAVAEDAALAGETLRKTVSGRTIVLNTPIGGIPIIYRANGTLVGSAKGLQSLVGPGDDTGRWWVSASKVCQKWGKWLDGREHCYRMRVERGLVHWQRDDGRKGTARIVGVN
jgi:hypothetical protein